MVQVRQRILRLIVLLPLYALAQQADISEPKFFPDDPLSREPPPLNVSKPFNREINDYYDFFQNTFFPPDKEEIKHHTPGPSLAVNTLGEVPDSA